MVRIFLILILLCNVAVAKPVRIQNKAKLDKQRMVRELNPKLLSDKKIDKLTLEQIKEYLKEITAILEKLLYE